ncbi:hypothetical protein SB861_56195, partial [Paraburkholderia sp. SIMBA_049]
MIGVGAERVTDAKLAKVSGCGAALTSRFIGGNARARQCPQTAAEPDAHAAAATIRFIGLAQICSIPTRASAARSTT